MAARRLVEASPKAGREAWFGEPAQGRPLGVETSAELFSATIER
jgi:hypothetical protein